jgi:hypothetical protein
MNRKTRSGWMGYHELRQHKRSGASDSEPNGERNITSNLVPDNSFYQAPNFEAPKRWLHAVFKET